MRYWPNPAHKRQTTEAGPPLWRPNKEPCPDDMTVQERRELLSSSIPNDPGDPHSRRYNVRRTSRGIELYEAKWTRDVNGVPEFHGHPASYVPARVLRTFLADGKITSPEYNRLRKDFGCS
jgi:hypothetical protein